MTSQNTPNKEFSVISTEINNIISSAKAVRYIFMDDNEYKKLTDLDKVQYIYWSEIIQRIHFCSITSLQRVYKWINSMNDSYINNNYFGFCASLRGLIEACSDTYYTTSRIIDPIAENFSLIEKALNLEASTSTLSEEIENELIHYMYGRKLNAEERQNNPQSHNAKQVSEYLNHIGDQEIKNLYSELCQVSHPSMMSFAPFVFSENKNEFVLHNQDQDSTLNNNILDNYRKKIFLVISFAVLPSISLLKIISTFKAETMKSLMIDHSHLNYIAKSDFWNGIEMKIEASKKKQFTSL